MKYYIEIELRYDTYTIDEDGDIESSRYHNPKKTSELFDSEKEAIDFGNSLIKQNLWVEQYPGYVGERLNRKFGSPLVMFGLKNNSKIFIAVRKVEESAEQELNDFLQILNKPKL